MAIISSLAVGKSRKSAGNITYQHYYGKVVAKQKILANPKYVPTTAQVSQRTKQGLVGSSVKCILPFLEMSCVRSKTGSYMNNFIKLNKTVLYGHLTESLTKIAAFNTFVTTQASAGRDVVTSKGINGQVSMSITTAGAMTASFQDNKSHKAVSLHMFAQAATGGRTYSGAIDLELDEATGIWGITSSSVVTPLGVTTNGTYALMACIIADGKPVTQNNAVFDFTKA